MLKPKSKMLERIAMGVDLPGMVIPGQPLVEVSGHTRVLIENHLGVTLYEHNRIHARVCFGEICILGSKLELARMTKCQLIITGCIDSVTLQRRSE